jgi:hypothetical protein
MGRPAGARDPKLVAMLEGKATRRRLLDYCLAQYRAPAWFGVPWDPSIAVYLLGDDEIDVGDPLVHLTRPPSLRGRKGWIGEAAERRMMREARADVGNSINEVTKATRAARSALTRLRSAARTADASVAKWKSKLVVEDENGVDWGAAIEAGLDIVERLLEELPVGLDAERPPRRVERRSLLAARAAKHFDRALAPRELAVVGVLAGVHVVPRRDDTVATVLERERETYAQLAMRNRRRGM